MDPAERDALAALTFNRAMAADDVWRPSPYDVPELHADVVDEILRNVNKARTQDDVVPIGVAMQGRAGAGKTHLLGAVREKIQDEGGYFFLVNLVNGKTFWESTALCLIEGLNRESTSWGTQQKAFLRRLTSALDLPPHVRDAVAGEVAITREQLDVFIHGLRTFNNEVGRECQDTARALVLSGSPDFQAQDVGDAHLGSVPPIEAESRAAWGMTAAIRTPQQIVRDISRLLALTLSPTVIAIDQMDSLFALARTSTALFHQSDGLADAQADLVGPVADGLLTLRDITRRTLLVVSCLPDVWAVLMRYAPTPVIDRFRAAVLPDRIPTPDIGRAIVAKRFGAMFAAARFVPPYATWPIAESAFADAPDYTPRALLKHIEDHVLDCLRRGEITELTSFTAPPTETVAVNGSKASAGSPPAGDDPSHGDATGEDATGDIAATPAAWRALDNRFVELLDTGSVENAFDKDAEDTEMPQLLAAGLAAWIEERGPAGLTYRQDAPPTGRRPALHARLIQVLDEATEDEAHWSMRAIGATHAMAVISRVKNACTMAGIATGVPRRRLVLLRRAGLAWPTGKRTKEVLAEFAAAGGITHPVSDEDLRVFAALRVMRSAGDRHFPAWLRSRRPASGTHLMRALLGDDDDAGPRGDGPIIDPSDGAAGGGPSDGSGPSDGGGPSEGGGPSDSGEASGGGGVSVGGGASVEGGSSGPGAGAALALGYTIDSGTPFRVELASLRRHTVIFAGSGSGKTVLIRRLVEECARQGVSAIVLDPNNDLARLGDPWPSPPPGWEAGDDARARDYLNHTDVVVWTPRVSSGHPLSFQPLPDFTPVRDSPDEFDQAIRSAVEALAVRARVHGSTKQAQRGKAVLTEALQAYAGSGGNGLRGFTEFLADLPDGVSQLAQATGLAGEVSETLKAAMVTDPLFGGQGTAVDPGVLLRPAAGKRARVSVISFIGLTSDEERQSFVNQLQLALFAWIKRNPAGDRPLGGLLVMDEAQTLAPASGKTPCTASTIALASQARKYGLGLVFATQAPKGLHNQISGNATTQFFGLLNSPTQIDAARELAQAKGGVLPDIGLLNSGQFYAAGEGFSFVKVRTPLCLTHHPAAPLSPEEVIARAH